MNNISRLNLISDDPKFIVKPHDVSGERGQDINMTCLVDGNPPPSYTWFKNGNMNYVSCIFCLYKLTFMQGTPSILAIISAKNVGTKVVCGFFMK